MYFIYDESGQGSKVAVLEDSKERATHFVREKDVFGEQIRVARITKNRILLLQHGVSTELWLTGAGSASGEQGTSGPEDPFADQNKLTAKFGGRQIGRNSWRFERAELMKYYGEVMNDKDRLVKLFDSFEPVREIGTGAITGYRINILGEEEFIRAAGLQQDDVVLKVNSQKMSSRQMAMHFIRDFALGRATAFVIDVNRGGKPDKFVYQLR
jgi:hypothetical protein